MTFAADDGRVNLVHVVGRKRRSDGLGDKLLPLGNRYGEVLVLLSVDRNQGDLCWHGMDALCSLTNERDFPVPN